MRDRQVVLAGQTLRQVALQPARRSEWQCRHDDLVEVLASEDVADRERRVLVADLAGDLEARVTEMRDRIIECVARLRERMTLGPRAVAVAGGHDDVELAWSAFVPGDHLGHELVTAERPVRDDETAAHGTSRKTLRR